MTRKKKYKDALGIQNYALQIGDKSYTIDWAAPSSIPLFVGVELYNQLKNGFELSDMLDAMKNVSPDPLAEMSMLQGIANIMDSGYSQGGFDVILTPIKNICPFSCRPSCSNSIWSDSKNNRPITKAYKHF